MRPETIHALRRLAGPLDAAGIPFQLGGSGLLFAHGLVDRVGDLDLVFRTEDRDRLASVLFNLSGTDPDFGAAQEPGFVSDWRSTHSLDGQTLDLTGGVAIRIGGRSITLPFTAGGSRDFGGVVVPLAPAEQWWLIYRVHRVPARAAMLESVAGPERIDALLHSLDLTRIDVAR